MKNPMIKIKVIGIGGSGCKAIAYLAEEGVQNVDLLAMDSDAQSRVANGMKCEYFSMGKHGTGGDSKRTQQWFADEENRRLAGELMAGVDVLFLTGGMGGGTGNAGVGELAKIASERGILTVAIVFRSSRSTVQKDALDGIREAEKYANCLTVISNEQMMETYEHDTLKEVYVRGRRYLLEAIRGASDIINVCGYRNVDFSDFEKVLSFRGRAVIASAEGRGDNCVIDAYEEAFGNPIIERDTTACARAVLYNLTANERLPFSQSLKLEKNLAKMVRNDGMQIDGGENGNGTTHGRVIDPSMEDNVCRITIIATGFEDTPLADVNSFLSSLSSRLAVA